MVTGQLGLWETTVEAAATAAKPEELPLTARPHALKAKPPRYYQTECIEAIESHWDGSGEQERARRVLAVLATGLGKTVIFCTLAAKRPGRILVIAHRDELIAQAREELGRATGEFVGTEKAEHRCGDERLVVTSVQTMHRRLEKFAPDHFAHIVIDEAHRAVAESYQKIVRHFSAAKVLGVTATPDRGDERALAAAFDATAYLMDIEDGIDAGYLVPVEGVEVALDEIDLSQVSTVNGDLAQGELDEAMLKATEGVVRKTFELSGDEQNIIFTPGVKSAHAMCERMNLLAPGKAIAIDGETEPMLRKSLVQGFKERRYQFLFNCAIATEGFDAPATSIVSMACPTSSRSKYAQCAGRGTRVLPGIVDHVHGAQGANERRGLIAESAKPRMRILDFVGNAGKHSLVSPADILGANYTEEEVKAAKKALKANPGGDVQKALKEARSELKALAASLHAAKAKVSARVSGFDPFRTLGMNREDSISIRFDSRPASDNQVESLVRKGLPKEQVESLDYRAAGRLLKKAHDRQKAGLATLKQLAQISKWYPVSDKVSFDKAGEAMTYIASECGWGRNRKIEASRLEQILTTKGAQP